MKNVFNFVLWLATMSVILGAHFTAIPILVTVATAIYWIVSVTSTAIVFILIILFHSKFKDEILGKTWNTLSPMKFTSAVVQGLVSLWVYALVGWAWPFAMALIIYVTCISVRLNKQ